ncbi:hypothetical protein [Myxosarcina sp. GI1]|uniref:hypothetical protein n=1 Tax=Myxosarcina sp. GI1 TaxID=1541065 RepID=UPI00055B67AD|nr:hypothetical protein [Myxosarcina sp. GI1]
MLRDILFQNNQRLLSEIERLLNNLIQGRIAIPAELNLYFNWLLNYGKILLCDTRDNLTLLGYEEDSLLPEVLSKTQNTYRQVRWFDEELIEPVCRTRSSDRLCLMILNWLHANHSKTKNLPLAFSDGDFACKPVIPHMSLYFIPPLAQQCLMYLPLLYHEFGHILYACHEQEMNELVGELQEEISELLQPASQRCDRFAKEQAKERKKIVEVWHEWIQELFCDAVGFQIGGAAFIRAFSGYLQMLGRNHFYVPKNKLANRAHPVSWLRVKILAVRARQNSHDDLAQELEDTWSAIAYEMGITEDYYGYYDDELLPSIEQTIEDMLIETEPYCHSSQQPSSKSFSHGFNPIELLNRAWQNFLDEPSGYDRWEKLVIQELLQTNNDSSKPELNSNGFSLIGTKYNILIALL